jgi:hypothetical protein
VNKASKNLKSKQTMVQPATDPGNDAGDFGLFRKMELKKPARFLSLASLSLELCATVAMLARTIFLGTTVEDSAADAFTRNDADDARWSCFGSRSQGDRTKDFLFAFVGWGD